MIATVNKRPIAKRDLIRIGRYLREKESQDLASRFLQAAEESLAILARNPLMGSDRPTLIRGFPELQMFPISGFEKYLVFYQVTGNGIDVIRILHGSRDIGKVFRD